MESHFYKDIINTMKLAVLGSNVIYDQKGEQIDLEVLDLNVNFAELIGIPYKDILGNKMSTILDQSPIFNIKLSDILLDPKNDLNKKDIEKFIPKQNKWFRLKTYSTEEGLQITTIIDISDEVKERDEKMLMYFAIDDIVLAIDKNLKIKNIVIGKINEMDKQDNKYVGKNILDLFPEDSSGKLLLAIMKALKSNKDQTIDVKFNVSDNEKWYRISIQGSEIIPMDKKIVRIEDITEIKLLSEEKKDVEQMLNNVFESSEDAMFMLDVKDVNNVFYIKNNDYDKDLMEKNIEKSRINKLYNFFNEEQVETFYEKIHLCINSDSRILYEGEFELDNKKKIIQTCLTPIYKNNMLVYILGTRKDITEKRKMEEQLKYTEQRDLITGLYNRSFFEDGLKEYDNNVYLPLTIIMADIEGIKMTSNAFGYGEGYILLKKTANIISELLDSSKIIARIGEERIGIILTNTTSEEAEIFIKKIKDSFKINDTRIPLLLTLVYGTKNEINENLLDIVNDLQTSIKKQRLYTGKKHGDYSLQVILKALFEKSKREFDHSNRVSDICKLIAEEMQFSPEDINMIGYCGLVHDIGKVSISEHILNKQSKLNEDEFTIIKTHCEKGYRILSSTTVFSDIAKYILYHHERWDGTGYPNQIAGDEIPIPARIIGVADAFDAMIEERPYKKNLTILEAIDELKNNSGTQFAPDVVNVFVKNYHKLFKQ